MFTWKGLSYFSWSSCKLHCWSM